MMWALLLLLGVIAAVHWWEYKRGIQEYTFAQPATLERRDDIRAVLSEKTPLAVEVGLLPWRPAVVEKASWSSQVPSGGGMNASTELALAMDLTTGLADLEGARAWWWLPGLHDATVGILSMGSVQPFRWAGAERTWIGCSHGAPLTVWLVHSRYRRFLPDQRRGFDPWNLTVADTPWIGRVQFVEVLVKPGWAIGLPAGWGAAIRPMEGSAEDGGRSWWWQASQHSVASWAVAGNWRVEDLLPAVDDGGLEEELAGSLEEEEQPETPETSEISATE
jgi:hypothetical protein